MLIQTTKVIEKTHEVNLWMYKIIWVLGSLITKCKKLGITKVNLKVFEVEEYN